ncbi:MAG TPA: tyrosine phenol-lyase, partial [bacterium (Candidatus Stahlbacteria)]|nr:tyrosine phenol-lyase [Candidatus Stahlbacteria bacterium]
MEFEPYRIMAIEPLPFPSRKERRKALGEASYNVFHLRSRMITIDLVSDSGTGTMSVKQWRNLLMADEAFSFQKSYDDFVAKAKELTGFEFILPVHQARAAEHILCKLIIRKGTRVIANHLFATTREHLIRCGAEIFELPREGSGDINLKLLKKRLKKDSVVILSVT